MICTCHQTLLCRSNEENVRVGNVTLRGGGEEVAYRGLAGKPKGRRRL